MLFDHPAAPAPQPPSSELASFLSAFSGVGASAEVTPTSPSPSPSPCSGPVVTAPPEARGVDDNAPLSEAAQRRTDAVDGASNVMSPGAGVPAATAIANAAAASVQLKNAGSPAALVPPAPATAVASAHLKNAASPAAPSVQPPLLVDEEMVDSTDASGIVHAASFPPAGLDHRAVAEPAKDASLMEPTPEDVLFGSEPFSRAHPGTMHMALILDALQPESYELLVREKSFQDFVSGVIGCVHLQGGRFLKRDLGGDQGWREVDDGEAKKLISSRCRMSQKNRRKAMRAVLGTNAPTDSLAFSVGGGEPKSIGGTGAPIADGAAQSTKKGAAKDKLSSVEAEPCDDLGAGWTKKVVPRTKISCSSTGVSSSTRDTYYFSPGGRQFRSLVEVKRYLNDSAMAGKKRKAATFVSECASPPQSAYFGGSLP